MSAITTIATHCCIVSKGHSHLLKFQIHLPNTAYVIFLYFSTPNICLFASSSFALYSTRSCLLVPTYVLVLITRLSMFQRKALDSLVLCMRNNIVSYSHVATWFMNKWPKCYSSLHIHFVLMKRPMALIFRINMKFCILKY